MNKYVKILKENNVKITPQRLEIMKFLDEHRTHPDVDEIYSELKKDNPSLSKTTVYNTLEMLRKNQIVQKLSISEKELRYDFRADLHHHFLCRKCGSIIDIDVECPYLEEMLNGVHKIEEVHGYFKGICNICRQKKKSKKGS